MGLDPAERLAIVDRLLADPPVVHPMDRSSRPAMGVWSTEASAYRFIAERCDEASRTLETGLGLSTALFAALGCEHTCVTGSWDEVERLRTYCDLKGFDTAHVRFEAGGSHAALPRMLDDGELDLVLVDGGHGYPTPILDWFYAGYRLRPGGVALIDDVHLPAVRSLLQFLDRDPRWPALERNDKWHAYERRSSGPLVEDWTDQPHYVVHPPGLRSFVRRAVGKARSLAGR